MTAIVSFCVETDYKVMFGIRLLTQHDRSDWIGDLSNAAKAGTP